MELFLVVAVCGMGFNRYMVECELSMPVFFRRLIGVLIDTWWNVNKPAFFY